MTKAYLYDSLCGIVFRCMFAGIDNNGHAQWVNITPGEEPKTLDDYVADENLDDSRFFVLAMEGETVHSTQIAKVLGKVAECPINGLSADLTYAVKNMQDLGIKWNLKPLNVTVRVFENEGKGKRIGKYSYWIEDNNCCADILSDVDGFNTLEQLFKSVRTYFIVMEFLTGISCVIKDLRIDKKLRKETKKSDLSMFDNIENETYLIEYKRKSTEGNETNNSKQVKKYGKDC